MIYYYQLWYEMIMFDEKTVKALDTLYSAGGIPFSVLNYKGDRLFTRPAFISGFFKEGFMQDPPKTLSSSEHPAGITIVETGELTHMAIVKINDECYAYTESVFASSRGAVSFDSMSSAVREDKLKEYTEFIRKMPVISDYQLASYVSLIKYICAGEHAEGINFYRMKDPYHLVADDHAKTGPSPSADKRSGYSVNYQKSLLQAVKSGDRDALEKVMRSPQHGSGGFLSNDPLTQRKYEFVLLLKEASEAVIECGADSVYIIELFENWCSRLDHIYSISQIDKNYHYCLMTLCDKAKAVLPLRNYSLSSSKAVQYIQNHLYDTLTIQIIADALHTNRQSLARTFEKDTKISLREYIIDQKLEEACRLLKKKELSITDISVILAFSSQSHFTELFKRKYSMTPNRYRRNSSDTSFETE